jgi:hypothetical protein
MKKPFSILFFSFALASLGHSATYASNFDNLTVGDLPGQDGWSISGAPISSSPGQVATPAGGSGNNVVAFGYYDLDSGSNSAYLSHSYGESLVGTSDGYTQFLVTVGIVDSGSDFPNRDTFGFTFRDVQNQNLFSINFTPKAESGTTRVDDVTWSNYVTGQSSVIGTLSEGSSTTIDLKFEKFGLNDVKFTLKSEGFQVATGNLTGLASSTIATFGATVNSVDSSGVMGGNQLVFDNISLIPEPSAALLSLLGASLTLIRRRRA